MMEAESAICVLSESEKETVVNLTDLDSYEEEEIEDLY
jgi:hypothetical protein